MKGKIVLQGQVFYRHIGSLASREVSCDTTCWAHSKRAGTAWARAGRAAGALARRWAAGWGVRGWARSARTGARGGQASDSGAGARRRSGRAGAGARGARASGRREGRAGERQARGARDARQGAAAGAGRAAWAWLGARAGQDCALGALDLIFKPVFRLSIFSESVNEHCSL